MSEHTYTPLGPHYIFKALGSSLRLHLFEYLCHKDLTVADLQEITQENYKTIYTRLKILESKKLIKSYVEAKNRYYITKPDALAELKRWQEMYSDILEETYKS